MILLHIHLIQYLEHSVSNEGIKILDSHVNKILDWKLQTTAKGLQSSLGFTIYYLVFIPEYGKLSAPMNGMRNHKGDLEWTPSMICYFET